jgi:hypothetical protein
MVGHINHDAGLPTTLLAKQQHGFKLECGLVVKQGLPPSAWHNFWEHDYCLAALWIALVDFFQIAQQWRNHGTVRGREHDEGYLRVPGEPVLLHPSCALWLHIHNDGRDVMRD